VAGATRELTAPELLRGPGRRIRRRRVQDPREVGSDLPLQALGRRDVWLVERPVKDGEVVEQPAIPPL
jgi:hypothetical protein